jgi:hypothetical protein
MQLVVTLHYNESPLLTLAHLHFTGWRIYEPAHWAISILKKIHYILNSLLYFVQMR